MDWYTKPSGAVHAVNSAVVPREKRQEMNGRNTLIVGGAIAAGLMIGAAALVVGVGLAKGDTGGVSAHPAAAHLVVIDGGAS